MKRDARLCSRPPNEQPPGNAVAAFLSDRAAADTAARRPSERNRPVLPERETYSSIDNEYLPAPGRAGYRE